MILLSKHVIIQIVLSNYINYEFPMSMLNKKMYARLIFHYITQIFIGIRGTLIIIKKKT